MSSENYLLYGITIISACMAIEDKYNIPKIVDCTDVLNEWVYPANKDLTRLLNTPSRDLPEFVRRFTQDIYLCIYIQPDFAVYGDFEDNLSIGEAENDGKGTSTLI